jgi:Kef-type K+ transport system membrane component KefB
MLDRDTFSALAVITAVAVIAPLLSDWTKSRIPDVVLEIGLGILVGPYVLELAKVTPVVNALSFIGLAFLFFMAGYEIDTKRVRGRPLRLATIGWFASLAIALVIAALLMITGFTLSILLIALALTTTSLGTLLPMLEDNGELHTRFGTFVLSIGGAGEFLPIVAVTVLLSGDNPFGTSLLLICFVLLSAGAIALALRPTPHRIAALLGRTLDSSQQLPIRIAVLLIVLLVWIASRLGLDVLLGAFAAGLVARLANQGETAHVIESKLNAIAFGVFVPVFFIVSGMEFDIDSLRDKPSTLLRIPFFLLMFLIVRGIPTWWCHRRDLVATDRTAAALLAATTLPLIVAITKIGLDRGDMRPENAAALVAAGMLSVLIFPASAFALRRHSRGRFGETATDAGVD